MLATSQHDFLITMADDKAFFKALGLRLAALRKEQGLSQQTVADELGIAQQTLAHYEVGTARMPVSIVPAFAKLYGVDANELLGLQNGTTGKRGPAPQLQQKIERLSRLPKAKQKFVIEMLDGMLSQAASR
jgi:transcriptional regulator with XRE-family HTH domain